MSWTGRISREIKIERKGGRNEDTSLSYQPKAKENSTTQSKKIHVLRNHVEEGGGGGVRKGTAVA